MEENQFYFTATCSAIAGVYIYRERESTAQSDVSPHDYHSEAKARNGIELEMVYIWRESTAQSDLPPPPRFITLKQKLEMVYSFTCYAALYMWSLYVLCHLELSKWTGQSCISFYSKYLSISLSFYNVVVVVVVVVYCTTGTITTTKFREIDYVVFVK